MSGRETGIRGVVTPEFDERKLDREVGRLEEAMNRASRLTPNIDVRGLRRDLERAIPGGGVLGSAVSRVGSRFGGGSQRGGGGSSGTDMRAILLAQNETLDDIRDLLEKRGVSEAGGGGGGGSLSSGLLLGRLLPGGGGAAAGAAGGALAGGVLAGVGATEANRRFGALSNPQVGGIGALAPGATGIALGGSLLAGQRDQVAGSLGIGTELQNFESTLTTGIRRGADVWEDQLNSLFSSAPGWVSDLTSDLSDLQLDVPSQADLPQIDVPDIDVNAPSWLQGLLGGGGRTSTETLRSRAGDSSLSFSARRSAQSQLGSRSRGDRSGDQLSVGIDIPAIEISASNIERQVDQALRGLNIEQKITDVVERRLDDAFSGRGFSF